MDAHSITYMQVNLCRLDVSCLCIIYKIYTCVILYIFTLLLIKYTMCMMNDVYSNVGEFVKDMV